ncbi:unnamed protein product, partial [marine sediment metagenome]
VDSAKEEKKAEIKQIATQEKVMSFLPPGKSRVKRVYPLRK